MPHGHRMPLRAARRVNRPTVPIAHLALAAALAGSAWTTTAAPSEAADLRSPRIVAAAMRDADGDARADRVRLTYSERVRHAADRDGRYPFRVAGYRIAAVGKAKGRKLVVRLAERVSDRRRRAARRPLRAHARARRSSTAPATRRRARRSAATLAHADRPGRRRSRSRRQSARRNRRRRRIRTATPTGRPTRRTARPAIPPSTRARRTRPT